MDGGQFSTIVAQAIVGTLVLCFLAVLVGATAYAIRETWRKGKR